MPCPASYPVTAPATRPSHQYGTATERFNLIDNAALEVDQDEPPGYRAPYAKLAGRIGAKHLAASVALPSSLAGQPNHGRNRRAELASDDFMDENCSNGNVYSL